MCAQATCSSSVRLARSVVSDIGEEAASASGGLLDIARCNEHNAERDTHRVIKRHHLMLDVPVRRLGSGILDLPILHLRDWLQMLLKRNLFHIIAGLKSPNEKRQEAILKSFWQQYKICNGGHPVYELAQRGKLCLERTAPLLVHGDEGRGRRRVPFLVTGYFSLLGQGSHPADRAKSSAAAAEGKRVRKPYLKLRPNFKGHSFTTRFLQVPRLTIIKLYWCSCFLCSL